MKNILIRYLLFNILLLVLFSCQNQGYELTESDFENLMNRVAQGWSTQNTDLALNCFDVDVIYMEPPSIQYYRGHEELRPYFDELGEVHKMEFHNLWFNSSTQSGAGEYTFSYGKDTADVGIVVVELKEGKIKFWREYQRKGPTNFNEYLQIEGKNWEWHIGNYPTPKDTSKR